MIASCKRKKWPEMAGIGSVRRLLPPQLPTGVRLPAFPPVPHIRCMRPPSALPFLLAALLTAPLLAQGPAGPAPDCASGVSTDAPGDALAAARALVAAGEACNDRGELSRALDRLGTELFRRNPPAEAWYLAGRARLALARMGAIAKAGPGQPIGMSYAQGAVAALREALHQDSSFAPAAALLASPELRRLARVDDDADAALLQRASVGTNDPALLLALANRQIEWHQPDSALGLVARALHAGGDPSLALLTLGRALLLAGLLADGQAAWLDGLGAARSDSAVAAYRRDVSWLLTDPEAEGLDSAMALDSAARRRWGEAFWARRAAADFRSPAARLAEHEERIRFALSEFPLRQSKRDYNKAMPFHSNQDLVDDRGVIYIRHGPPTHILLSGRNASWDTGLQPCPVYSWLYDDGPDHGLVVHFRPFFSLLMSKRRFCSSSDFKIVPGDVWIDHNAALLAQYDSTYAKWLQESRPRERERLQRLVREKDVDRINLAVSTDADPHHFNRDLQAVTRAYGLADPGRILVAFALPPGGLGRIHARSGEAIPLRLQLVALPGAGTPATLDTTFLYDASRPLLADQWLVGYVELRTPPGRYELRSLETGTDPDAGSFTLQPGVNVPHSFLSGPTVSALLLGSATSELHWPSASGPFPLSPLNSYPAGGTVEIYLEAHGLIPDGLVNLTLSLVPVADTGKAIRVSTTERATGTILVVRRSIRLDRTRPGRYDLSAAIRLSDGRTITREQELVVRR